MSNKKSLTAADRHVQYLKSEKLLNPVFASLKIIAIYLIIGFLWIFVSDELLAIFVTDPVRFQQLQTYKGWFYVIITAAIFYGIIYQQMKRYVEKIHGLDLAYFELDKVHQELLAFERQLHQIAYYDELTRLPNKTSLKRSIRKEVIKREASHKPFALVYMDVDDFRHINEMYGYEAGDAILINFAHAISNIITNPDVVFRLSEDEFIILIDDATDQKAVKSKLEHTLDQLNQDYKIKDAQMRISLSAGIAYYPAHGSDYTSLLRSADTALLYAKQSGKNRVADFESNMSIERTDQIELIQSMRQAIEQSAFSLNYQPIIALDTKTMVAAEALIRWQHPDKGFISPMTFIPLAEFTGLIHGINDFVFNDAFDTYNAWRHTALKHLHISINLSAKSLINHDFVDQLKSLCTHKKIACETFTLEITETALIDDIIQTEATLKELSEMGFEIALDDFGTGYSSLTYLKRLPIDVIKLDRTFIADCLEKDNDPATIKYIIDLAHHLKMTVVAEGIETQEQLDLLTSLGCDFAQGYHLDRPMSADALLNRYGKKDT